MESIKHLEKITQHFTYICGIDEAGRGPLAAPVFAAAVVLPANHGIVGLGDSKQLSATERERLFEEIISKAVSYNIVSSTPRMIDRINILNATKKAMTAAVKKLKIKPDLVLIDAVNLNLPEVLQLNLIKGDQRHEAISAASILAKVSRDRYMKQIDKKYPHYGFAKHKGYPTKEHVDALLKYGPCKEHRMTFEPIKSMIMEKNR
jgi:ribonuclease HII